MVASMPFPGKAHEAFLPSLAHIGIGSLASDVGGFSFAYDGRQLLAVTDGSRS
jgi:hypothetical protein